MFRLANREGGVIEKDFGLVTLLFQFKPGDGIQSRITVPGAPSLDKAFIRDKLELASDNAIAEERE